MFLLEATLAGSGHKVKSPRKDKRNCACNGGGFIECEEDTAVRYRSRWCIQIATDPQERTIPTVRAVFYFLWFT